MLAHSRIGLPGFAFTGILLKGILLFVILKIYLILIAAGTLYICRHFNRIPVLCHIKIQYLPLLIDLIAPGIGR